MRTVTPYLLYEDVAEAVQWLSMAFGFQETVRYSKPEGTVIYAELAYGEERVMLTVFSEGYSAGPATEFLNAIVYVTVDDVESHYARATDVGARIVHEPKDMPYGLRQYTVSDPQGQRWIFAEQVRDVLPEEWGGQQIRSPATTREAGADHSLEAARARWRAA